MYMLSHYKSTVFCNVAGGRSHGGEGLNGTMGTSEDDGANRGGALGADREPMDRTMLKASDSVTEPQR